MRAEEQYLGRPVRSLQTMLRAVAKSGAAIPYVVPDGIYGADTERAVRAFQGLFGLPVTGQADLATWQRLTEAFRNAQLHSAPAAPMQLLLQPGQVIRPGETNGHLYLIQAMLQAIGAQYRDVPPVTITGILDVPTQAAVRWLNGVSGQPGGADFTRGSWFYLAHLYRAAVQDGTL